MHNRENQEHENDPFYQHPSTGTEEQLNVKKPTLNKDRYREETATEFSGRISEERRSKDEENHVFGWIAIALSILSFFILPVFFAVSGIILGVIARNRQAAWLGYSAIAIGVLSLIIRLFIIPLT